MKKIFWVFFTSLAFLFLTFNQVSAVSCPAGGDPSATGLVPCGVSCECTISNLFLMLARIFNFIVYSIATPLAVITLTIGAIMLLISAGNPNLAGMGKKILWASAIGLVLVFCSWLIINFILTALGYTGAWNVL
jgi:hypothetical protein